MNRLLQRTILLEIGWGACALVSNCCTIDDPWEIMLWVEKNLLVPRHVGISQSTWNACVVAMYVLPCVAGLIAFVLSVRLTRRLWKRWGVSGPADRDAGAVTSKYQRIANGGGLCVAMFLLLSIVASTLVAGEQIRVARVWDSRWLDTWRLVTDISPGVLLVLWVPAVAAALATRCLLSQEPRRVLSRYCLACGYDLTGNVSGTCPECGTPLPVPASAPPDDGVH